MHRPDHMPSSVKSTSTPTPVVIRATPITTPWVVGWWLLSVPTSLLAASISPMPWAACSLLSATPRAAPPYSTTRSTVPMAPSATTKTVVARNTSPPIYNSLKKNHLYPWSNAPPPPKIQHQKTKQKNTTTAIANTTTPCIDC